MTLNNDLVCKAHVTIEIRCAMAIGLGNRAFYGDCAGADDTVSLLSEARRELVKAINAIDVALDSDTDRAIASAEPRP